MIQRKFFLCTIFSFLFFGFLSAQDLYWENPETLVPTESRFPLSAENNSISMLMWQEVESINAESGNIYLSMQVYAHSDWHTTRRFVGPIPYSGEVPSIASCLINDSNEIFVSVITSNSNISIYRSSNLGVSFSEHRISFFSETLLSPQLFQTSQGQYLLFATKGESENFTLVYSQSQDGINWKPFANFLPAQGLRNSFLPTHTKSLNEDILVFQAWQETNNRFSYQLFGTRSFDGGASWSSPQLLTAYNETGSQTNSQNSAPHFWHNQRPHLKTIGQDVYLSWERGLMSNQRYGIYFAQVSKDRTYLVNPEKISTGAGECNAPSIINYNKNPAVIWFDNRKGVNRIYLAEKQGFLWTESEISSNTIDAYFGRAVVVDSDLHVFWQQGISSKSNRIVRLSPDRTVQKPQIIASNFQLGKKSQNSAVRFTLSLPADSSGIAGYSYAWRQGSAPYVQETLLALPDQLRIQETALEDGLWYLGVKALDYAGNWSEAAYIEFVRDTTPPVPPIIESITSNPNGFAVSNTGKLKWRAGEEDDIAGYTWRFEYVAPVEYLSVLAAQGNQSLVGLKYNDIKINDFDFQAEASKQFKIAAPPSSIKSTKSELSFSNIDNGIYALAVSAIDATGNISKPAISYYIFNSYIPYTYISYIDSKVDASGLVSLSIIGRGFLDGGTLSEIILDRDGKEPWDLALKSNTGHFSIKSDRLVSGIQFNDLDEGLYRIILKHTKRGTYTSKPLLKVSEYGTVKFGDFTYTYVPNWNSLVPENKPVFSPSRLLVWSVLAFFMIIVLLSGIGITQTTQELMFMRKELQGILIGDSMSKDKRKGSALRVKGIGLRLKLAFFTGTLVLSVVLIVAIPLGMQFSQNQEQTLAAGLESRVNVLLDSLASGARAYLPSQNILELGFLPDQISALSEAKSATITGYSADSSKIGVNFVWATNDPLINERIDTPELQLGQSQLDRPENTELQSVLDALDQEAFVAVNEMSESISLLTQEGRALALRTDATSVQRREEIQTITRQLEEKLNIELAQLSARGSSSWPAYNPAAISREQTDYVFYKPVLFRQGADTKFVRGTVRIELSTKTLLDTVDKDRQTLLETTAIIALIALAIGVMGSLVLASIIISPVLKLASHVAMIRDTEDKQELDGKDIQIRSKDEIGLLGETINDMTRGLVRAAAASKDLTVGKEVQKMFIPLETDSMGRKLTSGSTQEKNAHFFGYYEGAKGVSGDYFDYIKLDDRHFAIIKCDVAGKGVPAALIMVEVATLFLDYFKDWTYKKNGYNLSYIVTRINDLIESRGFQGRFAAFTLCIFDSLSGDLHFCNAGDNLIHIFDSSTRSMKLITLPETSAAGVFPSDLVNMKGGFQVTKLNLKKGDILFLFTDGIEEAKRMFRTADLNIYICAEPGLEKDDPHGNHSVGQDNEELSPERVQAIIEAVLNRSMYRLEKWHNPIQGEILEFDFTKAEGTIEEAILALVSVEKIFRMYLDEKASEFERVQVDRKVDLFLNSYFKQYEHYCSKRKNHPEYDEYLYYTHVREDEQYDDLTLLAIKRI